MFDFKGEMAGQTGYNGTKDVKIMVPLKSLSNFCRNLKMSLINFEINLIFTWSRNRVVVSTAILNQGAVFTITDTKVYVPVVT